MIALPMVSNIVRVLDLVLLTKDAGASELRDADGSEAGQLRAAEADLAVLLAGSDVEEIGSGLEPGSVADAAAGAARAAGPGEVRCLGRACGDCGAGRRRRRAEWGCCFGRWA